VTATASAANPVRKFIRPFNPIAPPHA
jgi:hypothetical protein